MSTTAVLVSIGILGLAIAVAIQSAAEGGCAGAGMGFVGTIALSALCIAGFRAGGCHGCSTDGAAEERLHDGGNGGKQAPAKKSLFRSGSKTEKLRAFALAEAPAAWETYQVLAGEVELQSKRLEKLRKEMSEFGRNPEADDDFRDLERQLGDMKTMQDNVLARLEAAYIAARKCEATPGRKDLDDLRRKALQDGIQEAESAAWRYRQMREAKQ